MKVGGQLLALEKGSVGGGGCQSLIKCIFGFGRANKNKIEAKLDRNMIVKLLS